MTKRDARSGTLVLGTLLLLAAPVHAAAPQAAPPQAPAKAYTTTAEVLGQLHAANQKEIEAGNLAKKHGSSKAVKDFGEMLAKDHGAADKLVAGLAKQEKIDLGGVTPAEAAPMALVPPGPAFDAKFAQMMVEDHQKEIAEAIATRDSTTDDNLKQLLTKLIPTLQKHQDAAQKIVDGTPQ